MTLKEQLATMPDARTTTVPLQGAAMAVTLRRLTMHERDELLKRHKTTDAKDAAQASSLTQEVIAMALVAPATTIADMAELPATILDEIGELVMDFNGWSAKGRAALADQFRPQSGPAV